MIADVSSSMYRLNNLERSQNKLDYQMGGRKLQYGSDDSMLFGRLALVNNKILTQTGIKEQIERSKVLNDNSDASIAEVKNILDFIKSELIKANTSTTDIAGLEAIAGNIEGVKQNLLDLANTQAEGQYVFAGSDASVQPFVMDANGKVTYQGNDSLRKVAVDEGSYREAGVNGLDLFFYTASSALKNETLTFDSTDKLIDQDGAEWTLDPVGLTISKTNWDSSKETIPVTANVDGTYSAVMPNDDGIKLDAKRNIFDMIDNAASSLRGLDAAGNATLTYDQRRAGISTAQDELVKAQDTVVVAHADLGGRNKTFENALDLVGSKIMQYQALDIELGNSNLTEVATNLKSLELMFSALYSTISQTNQLSLVNYMR